MKKQTTTSRLQIQRTTLRVLDRARLGTPRGGIGGFLTRPPLTASNNSCDELCSTQATAECNE